MFENSKHTANQGQEISQAAYSQCAARTCAAEKGINTTQNAAPNRPTCRTREFSFYTEACASGTQVNIICDYIKSETLRNRAALAGGHTERKSAESASNSVSGVADAEFYGKLPT